MSGDARSPVPFDEQAALEELERLQRAIEEARRRRTQIVASFDDFLRSCRAGSAPVETHPPEMRVPVVRTAPRGPLPLGRPSPTVDAPPTPGAHRIETRRPRLTPAAGLGGALLVIVAGMLLTRSWRSTPTSLSGTSAVVASPPVTAPPTATTPGPSNGAGVRVELVTLRRVWVRILVDGKPAIERELPADQRIPLRAEQTIAIRTGDAGAVRVALDGQDQGLLGRDGEVTTRTFRARSAPAR
jgi:hypothetical protein